MIGAFGNDVLPHVAGDIQHVGLLHAAGNGLRAIINFLAVGGQFFGLVLHAQQVAQHPIGLGIGTHVGGDMDKGDARLLLQLVHVLLDAALALAHVNDHLRPALEQSLQIQLALAAVKLADLGHVKVFFVQKFLRFLAPCVGNAHQLVRTQGEQDDLCQRAAESHLVDLGGHLHLAPRGVGENAGGVGILRRLLAAAGGQTQNHDHGQQQRH